MVTECLQKDTMVLPESDKKPPEEVKRSANKFNSLLGENQLSICTDYTELDIERNFWKSSADATTGADTLHVAEFPEVFATDQHQAN